MGKYKLRGKDLRRLGYPESPVISEALSVISKHFKKQSKEQQLAILSEVLASPAHYSEDLRWGNVAKKLLPAEPTPDMQKLKEPRSYHIYGSDQIDHSAKQQMHIATQLPIAVKAALMPDAHHGYGLPIGGVLATENAVIPYGVGVDIGCRMCLSIFQIPGQELEKRRVELTGLLQTHTRFGRKSFEKPSNHGLLERGLFREIDLLKKLHGKAYQQLGSSGGGNHFVEFGLAKLQPNNGLGLPEGNYLALLSHSGSRGLGASIAQHYTNIAIEKCPLPKHAKNLAWLDLNSEEGQEYWLAMNLAGDYASACHHDIHQRISKALGERAEVVVENHHNFAWKEKLDDGKEVIVHRKGATPAGKGVLGIIPGSMTAPGFIVRGKGEANSISSASHGAGRKMSRSHAKGTLNKKYVAKYLKDHGITLLGGGLDEAPMAYKDIQAVMNEQQDLVDVLGSFLPKIVRMNGE